MEAVVIARLVDIEFLIGNISLSNVLEKDILAGEIFFASVNLV
jgi:hypothetical protein